MARNVFSENVELDTAGVLPIVHTSRYVWGRVALFALVMSLAI